MRARSTMLIKLKETRQTHTYTYPDPLDHKADVADALEVCALIDRVDGLHVTGDLLEQTAQYTLLKSL